jgi:hypothetical protein
MENIRSPRGEIRVEDNGVGMSFSTFKKTSMRIATTDKEERPYSKKYSRKKAGEKGIGRFACRMLSKELEVVSVSQNKNVKEKLTAVFNWNVFEPGTNVDKVPISISSSPANSNISTGTSLILRDINGIWKEDDIARLKNELVDLISPTAFDSISEESTSPE